MTQTEEKLIKAGGMLARSVGHFLGAHCPKSSPAVPCTCGAGAQQSRAVDAWYKLVRTIIQES